MTRKNDPRNIPAITYVRGAFDAHRLAQMCGGKAIGDAVIEGVATYGSRMPRSLCYQMMPDESPIVDRIALCTRDNVERIAASAKIVVGDPRAAFRALLALLEPDWTRTVQEQAASVPIGANSVHPTAIIEPGVIIARGAEIEPYCVIHSGSIIGEDALISAGAKIGGHGSVRGQSWARHHRGVCHIGKGVEIGGNSTILKGMLSPTRIGDGTIIGNMAHVSHGVDIGRDAWITVGVAICGHTWIGDNVTIGAGAILRDNIEVGHNAQIAMGAVVINDVPDNETVIGVPARVKAVEAKAMNADHTWHDRC
jgi:acetyltransferase-like isoleucine patch superfamily enzyme